MLAEAADNFSAALDRTHSALVTGNFRALQEEFQHRPEQPLKSLSTCLRRMRAMRLAISLSATNAVSDIKVASELLLATSKVLNTFLIAVVARAGGGKTQLAAQLTAPTSSRAAGLLLHGQDLHATHGLDDLARTITIEGKTVQSMESLLAAMNAAGERAKHRLPIVIDGLNEAEDPRKWKSGLENLQVQLSRFPYVLVVVTVRTDEFADESLPLNVERFEIPNFGDDLEDAIHKYFGHYLIDPGDAELPREFLSTPLILRLFCEVTNCSRQKRVGLEAMPQSLTALFDKYIQNAAERIAALSILNHRYYAQDVRQALTTFGTAVWENKRRGVDEKIFREQIEDTSRPWNGSLVRALEQEVVLARTPAAAIDHPPPSRLTPPRPALGSSGLGGATGNYITAVFDALGGHIVADSLIAERGSVGITNWVKEPEAISALTPASSKFHPLASDIFRSLVGLIPRRLNGQQFWQLLEEPHRTRAIRASKNGRSHC